MYRHDCSCQLPLYCQATLIEVSCLSHELGMVQTASLEALDGGSILSGGCSSVGSCYLLDGVSGRAVPSPSSQEYE